MKHTFSKTMRSSGLHVPAVLLLELGDQGGGVDALGGPHALQHLQSAGVHALEAADVEDCLVAGHKVQELLRMLLDAILHGTNI